MCCEEDDATTYCGGAAGSCLKYQYEGNGSMSDEEQLNTVPLWAEARGWDAERLAAETLRARRFCFIAAKVACSVSSAFTGVYFILVAVGVVSVEVALSSDLDAVLAYPIMFGYLAHGARKEMLDLAPASPYLDGFFVERGVSVLLPVVMISMQGCLIYQIVEPLLWS